jgi:hypothetical protein
MLYVTYQVYHQRREAVQVRSAQLDASAPPRRIRDLKEKT